MQQFFQILVASYFLPVNLHIFCSPKIQATTFVAYIRVLQKILFQRLLLVSYMSKRRAV
jgi:hypothetical protein